MNPSTPGLDAKVCNPEYNLTGITRAENTYKFGNKGWTMKGMIKVLRTSHKFLKCGLVRSSIQDHLLGMEEFLQRSIVTYFPDTFLFKQSEYHSLVRPKVNGATYQRDCPDSFTTRWSNCLTGKINGVEAHGAITGRKEQDTGWAAAADTVAACCIAGSDPYLFICVAGPENHLGEPDSLLKHTYFHSPILLNRFTTVSKAQLATFFIGTCRPHRRDRTWADIGVRPNELRLNPALIQNIHGTAIQAALAISAELCPQNIQPVNDSCFD